MNIQIGPHTFTSKAAAKQHARAIMKRHAEIGVMLPADEAFLRDLISIHPEAEQKIGCGIAGFTTQVDPIWRTTRHFVIIRTDGSMTDFSFHTCIAGNNLRILSPIANLSHVKRKPHECLPVHKPTPQA